jgi:2'-hydroxyisoflavone reductase
MSAGQSVRLLVLGGTRFVGRALVEAAVVCGHEVTIFNRGKTNPDLFPQVEQIRGDRTQDLSPLAGRRWDAVVDVAAYFPRVAELSVEALRHSVDHYLLVSSVSVYADQSVPQFEDARLEELVDPEDSTAESYGGRKAACERIVEQAFAEQSTVVRPGLIVGPHDSTDRFSYWPRRIARGGRILAPGEPGDPLQFIDVRDLAAFILSLVEEDRAGRFNATSRIVTFVELLEECHRVTGGAAELAWVRSEDLLAAGLDPWMGVPLWIAAAGWEAANKVPIERALVAGLQFRPLAKTIRAALHDDTSLQLEVGLAPQREADLLAQLSTTA